MSEYRSNQIIKCRVSNIREYGVFVEVDEDYVGLIHISQINGKFIKNINDHFKIGDIIFAKIIEVDSEQKQLKLSTIGIKQRKNRKSVLPETALGFELFYEILQDWIDEKIEEIDKIEKNKQ